MGSAASYAAVDPLSLQQSGAPIITSAVCYV